MNCRRVPAELYTVHADNGDPLLLYGKDAEGWLMLWPTVHIANHPIAFARWCKRNVGSMRGSRATLQHPMCARTRAWAEWLGVTFDGDQVTV